MIIKTGKKVTNLAKTPLRPAPRTSVVRGPADLRLKYENALYVTFDRQAGYWPMSHPIRTQKRRFEAKFIFQIIQIIGFVVVVKPQDGQRLTWDCCCRYIFPPESRPSCPGTCRYIDDRAEEELQQDYNNDDLSEGDVGTAPACETSHRYIYIYVDDGAKELTRRLHLLVKPPAVSPSVEPPRNGENALLSKVLLLISF